MIEIVLLSIGIEMFIGDNYYDFKDRMDIYLDGLLK
jgi:hypothetical protein